MASKSKKPENDPELDTYFEDLSTIDELEVLEEEGERVSDREAQAGLSPPKERSEEAEDSPQGGGLALLIGSAIAMVLLAGLPMVLVLGIFPAVYLGHGALARLEPLTAYLIWTAGMLVFVLLLRPGLPGILIRLFRNRHEHSEESLINHLTFIIDISKIARINILAIEYAVEVIENSFLRNGLRLVVDRVDRELIINILHSSLNHDLGRVKIEGRVIRDGAWAVLVASVLLAVSLFGLGGAAVAQAAMVPIIGLSWFFLLMLLERFHSKTYGLYAVQQEMIRDGVLYIERGERPEYIEEDLINYLPPKLQKVYDEFKSASAMEE